MMHGLQDDFKTKRWEVLHAQMGRISRPTVLKLVFLGFGCATFCIKPIYRFPGIYNLFLDAQ
ncbi:hypothetical protein A7Q26_11715 [Sphingobium sp. TCM1]|nr:hypothetical protein A7Q26_11715 [Sphingobium sp. TCM1]